jgi:hypothetical protein
MPGCGGSRLGNVRTKRLARPESLGGWEETREGWPEWEKSPMSVPTPRGLPPKAINADSPPEEPPGVRLRFSGFVVLKMRQNSHPYYCEKLATDARIVLTVQTHCSPSRPSSLQSAHSF